MPGPERDGQGRVKCCPVRDRRRRREAQRLTRPWTACWAHRPSPPPPGPRWHPLPSMRTYVRDTRAPRQPRAVTSEGSAYARFRRALDSGTPLTVRTAAAELARIGLDDALAICLLFLDARTRAVPPCGGTLGRATHPRAARRAQRRQPRARLTGRATARQPARRRRKPDRALRPLPAAQNRDDPHQLA